MVSSRPRMIGAALAVAAAFAPAVFAGSLEDALRLVPADATGVVVAPSVKAASDDLQLALDRMGRAEAALGGPLVKQAYLGSFQELTIDTALGPVFVVSPQVERQWVLGEELGLVLGEHGVTVVAA